jgi:hypothetical protein
METLWRFLKTLNKELSYGPIIPVLVTYLKEIKSICQRHSCTPTYTATVFTIAKKIETT